jgi:hypothetical protein
MYICMCVYMYVLCIHVCIYKKRKYVGKGDFLQSDYKAIQKFKVCISHNEDPKTTISNNHESIFIDLSEDHEFIIHMYVNYLLCIISLAYEYLYVSIFVCIYVCMYLCMISYVCASNCFL